MLPLLLAEDGVLQVDGEVVLSQAAKHFMKMLSAAPHHPQKPEDAERCSRQTNDVVENQHRGLGG